LSLPVPPEGSVIFELNVCHPKIKADAMARSDYIYGFSGMAESNNAGPGPPDMALLNLLAKRM